jgi:6-phosphogluconolactonase
MIERVVASKDILAREFRALLERHARAAGGRRAAFSMAIPGGSVAQAFLPTLVDANVSWERVHVFWCDERMVPFDDPESNWLLAWQCWLRHLAPRSRPHVHRMPAETRPMELAAEHYARELRDVISADGSALDLALLGLGPDGHVASLFLETPALLQDDTRAVAAVHGAPKPPPERLTLTLPFLMRSRLVVLAAFGVEKAEIVRTVLEDQSSTLPAALLLRNCVDSVFLMDAAAASLLT